MQSPNQPYGQLLEGVSLRDIVDGIVLDGDQLDTMLSIGEAVSQDRSSGEDESKSSELPEKSRPSDEDEREASDEDEGEASESDNDGESANDSESDQETLTIKLTPVVVGHVERKEG